MRRAPARCCPGCAEPRLTASPRIAETPGHAPRLPRHVRTAAAGAAAARRGRAGAPPCRLHGQAELEALDRLARGGGAGRALGAVAPGAAAARRPDRRVPDGRTQVARMAARPAG